ncbi:hypothetical protein FsymDg_1003 [Candidatus Protofrankia datiscae]|uniref:Uncharacterized protein n=1 Tax=Candidatus Protofrankia datiscae TaxID=2716812 RepID=F8AY09_9ACTN|nr:hypothetical protein FsymDg_1003 [Candidatus Protofrankia datiscae]
MIFAGDFCRQIFPWFPVRFGSFWRILLGGSPEWISVAGIRW